MPKDEMIIVRNEYVDEIIVIEEKPETAIESIKATDITQDDYIRAITRDSSKFWNFGAVPPLVIFGGVFSLVCIPGAVVSYFVFQNFFMDWLIANIVNSSIFHLPLGVGYAIHRIRHCFKRNKALKNPAIHTEKLLYENISAFNQRVEITRLLEEGDELSSDEKEEARLRLNMLKEDLEQHIEKFRKEKKERQTIDKLRKELDGASLKALPANTTEMDVVLEGGILAREQNLAESEQELNSQLQTLSAEIRA